VRASVAALTGCKQEDAKKPVKPNRLLNLINGEKMQTPVYRRDPALNADGTPTDAAKEQKKKDELCRAMAECQRLAAEQSEESSAGEGCDCGK
jgi:hypothetical protein